MKTILITAANGMFGSKTAEILAKDPEIRLRLMLRDASKSIISGPNVEFCTADMDKPETMEPHFAGTDSVFLVSPMDHRLQARESSIVEICKRNNVKHIVKMHGAVKHDVDELGHLHQAVLTQVMNSGLEWTLVSPNSVMETSLFSYQETISKARAIISCAGNGKIGLVALKDVAQVLALVLKTEGHHGMNYEITGPASLTMTEVAEAFTRVFNKKIDYIDLSEEDFSAMMYKYEKTMTPERLEMEILCHLRAWKRGGADVVTDTYYKLCDRQPTSIDEFIRENYNFFKKGMVPGFIAKGIRKSMLKK